MLNLPYIHSFNKLFLNTDCVPSIKIMWGVGMGTLSHVKKCLAAIEKLWL